jgi:hypothetical protein
MRVLSLTLSLSLSLSLALALSLLPHTHTHTHYQVITWAVDTHLDACKALAAGAQILISNVPLHLLQPKET